MAMHAWTIAGIQADATSAAMFLTVHDDINGLNITTLQVEIHYEENCTVAMKTVYWFNILRFIFDGFVWSKASSFASVKNYEINKELWKIEKKLEHIRVKINSTDAENVC